MNKQETLENILQQRIMIFDGAMGTMLQGYKLEEEDFRGQRFVEHEGQLKGCNELLSLTQPHIIEEIHRQFLDAGADIIETNTFGATSIAMADYDMEEHVYELNKQSAIIARKAADAYTQKDPSRPRFVAGSMGPTTRTGSLSPDVNDPGFRNVTFMELVESFTEQISGLVDGGVDILLPETHIDTLNLKAALYAAEKYFQEHDVRLPVIASFTIPDQSGRTLSGQTLEALWYSVRHANLFAISINCALGATEMRPFVQELSKLADTHVSCYPNAGLPNEFGEYDDSPEFMANLLKEFAEEGWLNIVGGCCGTRPEHIKAIHDAVGTMTPRTVPEHVPLSTYSGMEAQVLRPESNFFMVGERTNVTGSRRFKRLITSEDYEAALSVARQQVEGGANIIDINMDEGLLDSPKVMVKFLNLLMAEPDIARLPIMIDSSKFEVLEAGLQVLQGKSIVNSISLKEGEEIFKAQATECRMHGAAVVVMAFDEEGQATGTARRVEILSRAYKILTEEVHFPPEDIIFDPNILTVATGMEEHNDYAMSFIESVAELKKRFPLCKISGGISNISFSFRGNPVVREAMHAAFLYHAIQAGLDMGIVNAGQLEVYEEIPEKLKDLIEDVLFNKHPEATDKLVEYAENFKGQGKKQKTADLSWRENSLQDRLAHALLRGITDFLEEDIKEALETYNRPIDIIEGPLLDGMNIVGDLFGEGKMFLPQVVKSARAMKKAVSFLLPIMEKEKEESGDTRPRGKILMATVKGDVHDIGKNIVGVVLGCNNYDIIDLGVMVPANKILKVAKEEKVDVIGLSGLITPSLDEMVTVAKEMQHEGFNVPLLIGGATTSSKHTAVKIAPMYEHLTVHVRDASRAVGVVGNLLSDDLRADFEKDLLAKQAKARESFANRKRVPILSYKEAEAKRFQANWSTPPATPSFLGTKQLRDFPLEELVPYIDWTPFFKTWELHGRYPAILEDEKVGETARELFEHAQARLDEIVKGKLLQAHAVYGFFPANSDGNDIILYTDEQRNEELMRMHTLRQQKKKKESTLPNYALADFVAPKDSNTPDYIGGFAVTTGHGVQELVAKYEADHDDYNAILVKALADRLAEAFAEYLHAQARKDCGFGQDEQLSNQDLINERYRGIRPAPGYPACPDHTEKGLLFDLLDAEKHTGISLTESFAMMPAASVSGLYFNHPQSKYFAVGFIGRDQVEDYAKRKDMSLEKAEQWLAPQLNYDPNA
ncbi:MAG: methionine synthase [Deltaproteobacteria bacterium]|nr:methionine synthase [Deltaproteobacteria bacterium]|tara:strand:+ start:4772 stop:8458 length:3687 start_codon:yes stop_codon:yes gene_type:complete